MNEDATKRVFLSGATGFVGTRLYPRLVDRGFQVRCGSRAPQSARRRQPHCDWVKFDVEQPDSIRPALQGCDAMFYLVHQMTGGGGGDYRHRETEAALQVRRIAERAGIHRIVYLGGVRPQGEPSEHLRSRLQVGETLRDGQVSTVELRASMIIGAGSESWRIVRDLAARLPVMVLPKWTKTPSQPVHIDDVVQALIGALQLEMDGSKWFDIPGPKTLTAEQILVRTARQLGHRPRRVGVPVLTPRLSSWWLRFVTEADLGVARELVDGLTSPLIAESDRFWHLIDHTNLVGFDEAARREMINASSLPAWVVERLTRRVAQSRD